MPTTGNGALVLISADVTGDAQLWRIDIGHDGGYSSITAADVMLSATLVGVNDLAATSFDVFNFRASAGPVL